MNNKLYKNKKPTIFIFIFIFVLLKKLYRVSPSNPTFHDNLNKRRLLRFVRVSFHVGCLPTIFK